MTDETYDEAPVEVDHEGAVLYRRRFVGHVSDGVLTINLGWARLAGLGVRVENDPAVDRFRSGVVLERPAP